MNSMKRRHRTYAGVVVLLGVFIPGWPRAAAPGRRLA
jgi:hypothetical protein